MRSRAGLPKAVLLSGGSSRPAVRQRRSRNSGQVEVGRQRHIGPHVSPGFQLYGVSCSGARDCVAVGYGNAGSGNIVSLIERWDGERWTRDPSPNPRTTPSSGQEVDLTAVSCAAPTDCVAIGSYSNGSRSWTRPLTEIYRDGEWAIQLPINRGRSGADSTNQLDSISCPASTEC